MHGVELVAGGLIGMARIDREGTRPEIHGGEVRIDDDTADRGHGRTTQAMCRVDDTGRRSRRTPRWDRLQVHGESARVVLRTAKLDRIVPDGRDGVDDCHLKPCPLENLAFFDVQLDERLNVSSLGFGNAGGVELDLAHRAAMLSPS